MLIFSAVRCMISFVVAYVNLPCQYFLVFTNRMSFSYDLEDDK